MQIYKSVQLYIKPTKRLQHEQVNIYSRFVLIHAACYICRFVLIHAICYICRFVLIHAVCYICRFAGNLICLVDVPFRGIVPYSEEIMSYFYTLALVVG
jgi:hypothetical protein